MYPLWDASVCARAEKTCAGLQAGEVIISTHYSNSDLYRDNSCAVGPTSLIQMTLTLKTNGRLKYHALRSLQMRRWFTPFMISNHEGICLVLPLFSSAE